MTCTGIVREGRIELEDAVTLPEGTRVRITVEKRKPRKPPKRETLGEWLEKTREVRERLPMTSDSVEILREIREERSNR